MGVVENVRFVDLYSPIVSAFSGGRRLLVLLVGCARCLYAARSSDLLSLSTILESNRQAGFQYTSYVGCPLLCMVGLMCLISNPSFMQRPVCSCVRIVRVHWVTKYVFWLLMCLRVFFL